MKSGGKSVIINTLLIVTCLFCVWYICDSIKNNRSQMVIGYILFIVITFYVSISIHECSHSLVFLFYRMKMRAICIFPFCFLYGQNGWNIVISWNGMKLLGASVPEQFEINSEIDFNRIKKAYAYSMLVATLSGILMTIIGLVILIISSTFLENESLKVLGNLLFFINFLLVISSFTRTENASGDFFAYKYMFRDDEIATQLIFNYMKFSLNYNLNRKNSLYLRRKLEEIFEAKVKKGLLDIDAISIATSLITEYLIIGIDLPLEVEKYITEFYDNSKMFDEIKDTELFKKFITKVAYYFNYIGNQALAKKIYNDYIINFSNKGTDIYLKTQAEQIIFNIDNRSFLLQKKNIKPDSLYSFYRIFDGYIADELFLNE